jgi:hypothetical protein
LLAVPPDRVRDFWPIAVPYIQAAMERNGITPHDSVRDSVFCGTAILWMAADDDGVHGAGVTQLCGGVCEIVAWGCDQQSRCTCLLDEIETYAKAEGCTAVRLVGPRAWQRITGYDRKAVILEKVI